MKRLVIYIHGMGGTPDEAKHYIPIFKGFDVIGFDYKANAPKEAVIEFKSYLNGVSRGYDEVYIVAVSLGAYFSLITFHGENIKKAFLISPVTDMEKLILDMMRAEGVTEDELKRRKKIPTRSGTELSLDYLNDVRSYKINPTFPISILYGENDALIPYEIIKGFAERTGSTLTVMKNGEHWFHTDEQMKFLDGWLEKELNDIASYHNLK